MAQLTPKSPGSLDDGLQGSQVKGVFSSRETDPESGEEAVHYWFAKQIGEDEVKLRELGEDYLPTQNQRMESKADFLLRYSLEPELGYKLVTQRIVQGEWYRKQGLNNQATDEYQSVLGIDEENIRANFGLGLTYLAMNQTDKSKYVLGLLVKLDESFEEAHKHLFNEFGIALRKRKLYDEALSYYARAASLCPHDENIFLNMARACLEKGEIEKSYEFLRVTFELNPNVPEALAFLHYLQKNEYSPSSRELADFFAAQPVAQ